MTIEKTSETTARRVVVSHETVTIESLELKKQQHLAMVQRLQDSMDAWQAKADAIDGEIAQLRDIGVKTQAEYAIELQKGAQGGGTPDEPLP